MVHEDAAEKFIYTMRPCALDALKSWRFVVMLTEIHAKLCVAQLKVDKQGFPLFENDTDMYVSLPFQPVSTDFQLGQKIHSPGKYMILT